MAAAATGWGNKRRRRLVEEISVAELIPGLPCIDFRFGPCSQFKDVGSEFILEIWGRRVGVKGLRQIIVRKDGSDDMEVVHVGTIMIQNGYAYVAGKVIFGEEPNHFLDKIYFPPFVITFPPVSSDDEAKEHYEKNKDQIQADLVRTIETHNYVPAKFRCLEFEFEFDGEPDLSEQNLCGVCKGQIYEGGYEFCEDCGDTLMEYYSCKNHREVSMGLDLIKGTVRNNLEAGVIEPAISKVKIIQFSTEAAITILRIDDMIKIVKDEVRMTSDLVWAEVIIYAVGSEEPTERDHDVDLQQQLLIKIDFSDSHKK